MQSDIIPKTGFKPLLLTQLVSSTFDYPPPLSPPIGLIMFTIIRQPHTEKTFSTQMWTTELMAHWSLITFFGEIRVHDLSFCWLFGFSKYWNCGIFFQVFSLLNLSCRREEVCGWGAGNRVWCQYTISAYIFQQGAYARKHGIWIRGESTFLLGTLCIQYAEFCSS